MKFQVLKLNLFQISGTKMCSLPEIKRSRIPKITCHIPDVDELLTKEAEPWAWRWVACVWMRKWLSILLHISNPMLSLVEVRFFAMRSSKGINRLALIMDTIDKKLRNSSPWVLTKTQWCQALESLWKYMDEWTWSLKSHQQRRPWL